MLVPVTWFLASDGVTPATDMSAPMVSQALPVTDSTYSLRLAWSATGAPYGEFGIQSSSDASHWDAQSLDTADPPVTQPAGVANIAVISDDELLAPYLRVTYTPSSGGVGTTLAATLTIADTVTNSPKGMRYGLSIFPVDMGGQKIESLGRSSELDGAARIDDIADHVTLPRPNGIASAGVSVMASPSDHVHEGFPGSPGSPVSPIPPTLPPAIVETTLYTAKVPDPLLRTKCRGLLPHGEGVGFGALWLPSTGLYTWQKDSNSVLTIATNTGIVFANAGDRLLAWNSMPFGADEPMAYGIYVVVDPGSATTKAIITRAPDANTPATFCHGMTVQIDGPSNVEHNGDYFTLTTADPIVVDTTALTFSVASSYTAADKYELLTGPQLTSEGASNDSLEMSAMATSGDALFPLAFETLVGTPALSALPAGIWQLDVELINLDDAGSPGSVTTLQLRIINATTAATVFTMESPPISNMAPAPLSFQYSDAGHPLSPTDSLEGQAVLHTTSTTPVKLNLLYSSPTHGTRITVPFTLPVFGAVDGVHNHLSGRSDPDCHPASAILPVVDDTTGNGWLFPTKHATDRADSCTFTITGGSNDFQGISKMWNDGTPIPDRFRFMVYITNAAPSAPKRVVNGATPPGSTDYLPLALDAVSGVGKSHTFTGPTALWFWLNLAEQRWMLESFQTYTVPTS